MRYAQLVMGPAGSGKVCIVSMQVNGQCVVQIPRICSTGFRASGLPARKLTGLQDRNVGALRLHGSTLELHLALFIIFVWNPSRKRLI